MKVGCAAYLCAFYSHDFRSLHGYGHGPLWNSTPRIFCMHACIVRLLLTDKHKGPSYFLLTMEAMIDAGVHLGLPRSVL